MKNQNINKPKYRYVKLPNGKRRRMTEAEIATHAGMWNDPIIHGGTVSPGLYYLMIAARERAEELGIDPIGIDWIMC
jgi:hypothetical protein